MFLFACCSVIIPLSGNQSLGNWENTAMAVSKFQPVSASVCLANFLFLCFAIRMNSWTMTCFLCEMEPKIEQIMFIINGKEWRYLIIVMYGRGPWYNYLSYRVLAKYFQYSKLFYPRHDTFPELECLSFLSFLFHKLEILQTIGLAFRMLKCYKLEILQTIGLAIRMLKCFHFWSI